MFEGCNPVLIALTRDFVSRNDPGHNWSHVLDVATMGLRFAEKLGLDDKPFLLAAACHDMFSGQDRDHHHELAGEWVRANLSKYEDERYVGLVARMCEQHRSSYHWAYDGLYEEAFASADRGPIGIEHDAKKYWRSYQYNQHRYPSLSPIEICGNVAIAMFGRFGVQGSVRWPELYQNLFGAEIKAFNERVEAIRDSRDVMDLLSNARYL